MLKICVCAFIINSDFRNSVWVTSA